MEDHADAPDVDSPVRFVGPFKHHDVVVDGRCVPYLHAAPLDGGKIDLTLDRRFCIVLSAAEAERFIPFLANAIAVASGFTCHPDAERGGPNPRHPFPRISPLLDAHG